MPVPKYYSLKMTGFGVKPVIGSDFCLGTVCTVHTNKGRVGDLKNSHLALHEEGEAEKGCEELPRPGTIRGHHNTPQHATQHSNMPSSGLAA